MNFCDSTPVIVKYASQRPFCILPPSQFMRPCARFFFCCKFLERDPMPLTWRVATLPIGKQSLVTVKCDERVKCIRKAISCDKYMWIIISFSCNVNGLLER